MLCLLIRNAIAECYRINRFLLHIPLTHRQVFICMVEKTEYGVRSAEYGVLLLYAVGRIKLDTVENTESSLIRLSSVCNSI